MLPVPSRGGRGRDRRGRGLRGPLVLPGPLTPRGSPLVRSRAQRFDELVLAEVERVEARWREDLRGVEFGVEDAPELPEGWEAQPVPLAALVPAAADSPARVVLFRRPIELRAAGPTELTALIHELLVEQVADLLGRDPDEVSDR